MVGLSGASGLEGSVSTRTKFSKPEVQVKAISAIMVRREKTYCSTNSSRRCFGVGFRTELFP